MISYKRKHGKHTVCFNWEIRLSSCILSVALVVFFLILPTFEVVLIIGEPLNELNGDKDFSIRIQIDSVLISELFSMKFSWLESKYIKKCIQLVEFKFLTVWYGTSRAKCRMMNPLLLSFVRIWVNIVDFSWVVLTFSIKFCSFGDVFLHSSSNPEKIPFVLFSNKSERSGHSGTLTYVCTLRGIVIFYVEKSKMHNKNLLIFNIELTQNRLI